MNVVESYCLLICGGLVACVFTLGYFYFCRCLEVWQIKRHKRNELYKVRVKKIRKSIKDYYYTLAITRPYALATELAKSEVKNMIKKNTVFENYTKLKCSNM